MTSQKLFLLLQMLWLPAVAIAGPTIAGQWLSDEGHLLQEACGEVDGGNVSLVPVPFDGPLSLRLHSHQGDADLYVAGDGQLPSWQTHAHAVQDRTQCQPAVHHLRRGRRGGPRVAGQTYPRWRLRPPLPSAQRLHSARALRAPRRPRLRLGLRRHRPAPPPDLSPNAPLPRAVPPLAKRLRALQPAKRGCIAGCGVKGVKMWARPVTQSVNGARGGQCNAAIRTS